MNHADLLYLLEKTLDNAESMASMLLSDIPRRTDRTVQLIRKIRSAGVDVTMIRFDQ